MKKSWKGSRARVALAMALTALVAALSSMGMRDAVACGMVGHSAPSVAPSVDAQDALPYLSVEQVLLAWNRDTQVEDFVREARFERADQTFGFIVPVPSKPEVFKVDKAPFASLRGAFPFEEPEGLGFGHGRLGGLGTGAGGPGDGTGLGEAPPVQVLSEQRIGSFTAFTLAARDAAAFDGWLDANGFMTTEPLRAWLAHYVRLGFYFVGLRYDPPGDGGKATSGMTSETVRIRFVTPAPYYPYMEPSQTKTPTRPRMMALWFVSQDEMTPVASSKRDAAAAAWAQPWRAGVKYTPSAEFMKGVVPTLEAIVPASAGALVVQTYRDYKAAREAWGDTVMVPAKATALDSAGIAARRGLFAVLDPALDDGPDSAPSPTPSASASPSTSPMASTMASALASALASASPSVGSGQRSGGCAAAAGGGPDGAVLLVFLLVAMRSSRRARGRAALVGLAALCALAGCKRETTDSGPAASASATASATTSAASSSADPAPSGSAPTVVASASAPPSASAAPPLTPEERAHREAALVELFSGKRSGALPVLAGFAPTGASPVGPSNIKAPHLRESSITVNGRLPPEVIQRIIRQNFGRFRLCYENGLRSNPALAGRVVVKFVIDMTGAVSMVADGGSTVPDIAVVQCIVRSFQGFSFPAPEAGVVTVIYPLNLAPAD